MSHIGKRDNICILILARGVRNPTWRGIGVWITIRSLGSTYFHSLLFHYLKELYENSRIGHTEGTRVYEGSEYNIAYPIGKEFQFGT